MTRWERWDESDNSRCNTFDVYLGSDTRSPEVLTLESDYSQYEKELIIKVPYTQDNVNLFERGYYLREYLRP